MYETLHVVYLFILFNLTYTGKNSFGTPGLEVIKLISCSTQLSMQFQLLIKTKMLKNEIFFALKISDVVFIMLIIVGIFNIYEHDQCYAQLT